MTKHYVIEACSRIGDEVFCGKPACDCGVATGRMLTPGMVAERAQHQRSCRDARCTRHVFMTYVPGEGWLEAAEAQEERRAYLDMDAAIDRAYDA